MIFRFASPWFLTLMIFIPLIALWPVLARKWAKPASLRYADTGIPAQIGWSWRLYLRPVLPFFRLLALTLLIFAVARPQTGQAREIIDGEGVDIALALDISGSMASLDFQPQNRLGAAKEVIADFISRRQYDRIGLVVFASQAFNQSPPTMDYGALDRLLGEVELAPDLGIEDGTAIGLGLANAASMLKDSPVKSKVVILLTDGVNNSGQIDPLTAAEAAKALGIRVYTVGAAKPGQVPVPRNGLFGRQIVYQESQLDEETLQQIADITGGLYFRAEDTAGLQQIYDQINELEKSQVEVRTFVRYRELATWLILPALLIFIFEMTLRQTIFRKIP